MTTFDNTLATQRAPHMATLEELRADFEIRSNRSLSMPISGAVVWLVAAVAGATLQPKLGLLFLVASTGLIFPLALGIANIRREQLVSNTNPLAKLMGACVLMVNLLWAVHLPLFIGAPDYVPLSLAVALGLHWIVYSWIIQHNLGVIHALLRTVLVLGAWLTFPHQRIPAIALAVVFTYAVSIAQMKFRKIGAA